MKFKKIIATTLASVMLLGVASCSSEQIADTSDGSEDTGSVYYLNFKPESAEAWEELATLHSPSCLSTPPFPTCFSSQISSSFSFLFLLPI